MVVLPIVGTRGLVSLISFLRAVYHPPLKKSLGKFLVPLYISDFNLTIKFGELEYFLVRSVGVCQNSYFSEFYTNLITFSIDFFQIKFLN